MPHPSRPRTRHHALAAAGALATIGAVAACSSAPSSTPRAPASASSSNVATPATPAATSPVRHMISAQGHKLAFYVRQGHSPAIVLDAGGGMDHSQWSKIAAELSKRTGSTVITYDRAGSGASSPLHGAWNPRKAAAELKTGLTDLGVTRNIVLVSHSLAGEVSTYFARKNPQAVSGAVLVDASLPQFYTDKVVAGLVAAQKPQIAQLKKVKHPTKQQRQLLAVASSYGPVSRAYHQVSWPKSIPVVAISSSRTPFDKPAQNTMARLWKSAQQQFVKAAPNRKLVSVKSSHNIPADRPDVVIKGIEGVID